MRTLANLLLITALLSLPTSLFAQSADPFGAGPAPDDPFGNGPAVRPTPKRPTLKPKLRAAVQSKSANRAAAKKLTAPASSDATAKIRAAMNDETSQTFIELPLADAIQQISATHDIPIVVDRRALEEIGLSADEPVTLSLHKVTLRSFLRLMLRDLDLTYMVKDEVMQITTIEAAEQNLVIEMYTIDPSLTEKADQVIKALTTAVVPDTWSTLGGPSSISAIDNILIVSTTEHVQELVIDFLAKLETAYDKTK